MFQKALGQIAPLARSPFSPLNSLAFGFGLANAAAQQQVQREIDQLRQNARFDFAPEPQVVDLNPQPQVPLQPGEELKEADSEQQTSMQSSGTAGSLQLDDFDLDMLQDASIDEEIPLLINEFNNNPNPNLQQAIMLDFEARRQVFNDVFEVVNRDQALQMDEQARRESLMQMIMRLPHDRIMDVIKMGANGVTLLTQVYAAFLMMRGNYVMRKDFEGMKPVYDPSYDTFIPLDKILSKPVPAHCKRVLFTDEYGRTRSKLICGNVQDKFGQRVYFNN